MGHGAEDTGQEETWGTGQKTRGRGRRHGAGGDMGHELMNRV